MASEFPYGPPHHKVTLLGASGGIGQPLALLLKQSPMISELALYDIEKAATPAGGVAADISHINTNAQTKGYAGDAEIGEALKGASVVIITAGVPRKPGMTRDDLFKINAGIVKNLAKETAKHCPKAFLCIVSNPVNSTVPIVAEVYKAAGVYDKKKLAGVTTLDLTRAATFVAEATGSDANICEVPVVGGHAGVTILPLLSQCAHIKNPLDDSMIANLDKRIQDAGTEVVNAKAGSGSATLSMAYAASKFADKVLCGLSGVKQTAYCYVNYPYQKCDFFAQKCDFGPSGIVANYQPENLSAHEKKRIEEVKNKLVGDIQAGLSF